MFQINYKPSGMLAAGCGTQVELVFTYNDPNAFNICDIMTELRIKHQDDILIVPISCFKASYKIQAFDYFKAAYSSY